MASTSSPGARRPLEQTDPQQPPAQSPSLHRLLGSDDDTPADDRDIEAQESTPLLDRPRTADSQLSTADSAKRPWWSIIAIVVLLVLTVNIIVFAFVVPNAAENYASQASTYSLHNIQIQNITDTEVIIKVQANITLDASRVNSSSVRRTGLFASNFFQHVYTKPCDVALRLPKYGGAQVGLLWLPALALDIRNRHINLLNITSNFTITDESLAIQLASEYASGKSGEIRAIGDTNVSIRAGIVPLGTHHVEHELVLVKGSYLMKT
jgi:hypothetical protein